MVANCYGLVNNLFVVNSCVGSALLMGGHRLHYRSHVKTVLSHLKTINTDTHTDTSMIQFIN